MASAKDLLLHKEFITQGGYNSMQEAISAGVPLVTIALFGDQPKNAQIAKKHGFAVNIQKGTISKETIVEALKELQTKSESSLCNGPCPTNETCRTSSEMVTIRCRVQNSG
ncbi:hypothetical protein L3Y34_001352 [Caenorhabditis briggsae]|uniref:glucuronosyltransferase n=1 Tax=Caenorhabditis briggsae TaxID=6238 RepID=A0AAE9IQI0_CAEBR|nr:hypothetical protein L3Y34_001352 [Caenorhabditis briggsae]